MIQFVSLKNSSEPVTYGYNFKVIVDKGYHSGGDGYLLSREALNRIGSKLNENIDFCAKTGTENVDVARCLRVLNVNPGDSIDFDKKERFHPFSLDHHFHGHFPDWFYSYAANTVEKVCCYFCCT